MTAVVLAFGSFGFAESRCDVQVEGECVFPSDEGECADGSVIMIGGEFYCPETEAEEMEPASEDDTAVAESSESSEADSYHEKDPHMGTFLDMKK